MGCDRIIKKLGFNKSYRVEAVGFSSGLWLLWDDSHVNIDIINNSSQHIHTKISFNNGNDSFYLTGIYASPIPFVREDLWCHLENISRSMGNDKWMCMGDFNAYKSVEDKQGGVVPNGSSMAKFVNCCNSCDLMDVKFCGPRFTWHNGRMQERLDWALANLHWYSHFSNAFSEHLNWFKSNHRSILVRLGTINRDWRTSKRFRFIATWITEASFKELVRSN